MTSLNPNVPEFVPTFASKPDSSKPVKNAGNASKAIDSGRDEDEAGTDGDDEAEIFDNQIRKNANKKDLDNWVEVKSKKQDRKSLPKDLADKHNDDRREELEFQFDEDLDMPVGRQNKFSSM